LIWDTAGQERYRSMAKIFYKDANAVIFVFDITRRNSFEEIKNYWYQQIKDNSPKNLCKMSIKYLNKDYSKNY
jgi:small GTP-binding protein